MNQCTAADVRLDGNLIKFPSSQRFLSDGPTYQSMETFFLTPRYFVPTLATQDVARTDMLDCRRKRKTSSGGCRKAVNLSGQLNHSHLSSSQRPARPRFSLALYISVDSITGQH